MIEHVLAPLGITTPTRVSSRKMVESWRCRTRPGPNGKPRPVEQVHFDVTPAGDSTSLLRTWRAFLAMHLNGGMFHGKRILSEASVKAAHEPQFGAPTRSMVGSQGPERPHHYQSQRRYSGPELYMVEIWTRRLACTSCRTRVRRGDCEAALKLLRARTIPPRGTQIVAVEPAVLDRYVGVYELSSDVAFTVSRDGNKLMVQQGSEQKKNELAATSPTSFIVKGRILPLLSSRSLQAPSPRWCWTRKRQARSIQKK